MIKNIGSFNKEQNSINWLITITKNLSINLIKKRSKEKYVDIEEQDWKYEQLQNTQENSSGELTDIFNRVLSDEEKEIVKMCLICESKRRKIAKIKTIPIGTVTWKYNQAIEKIKKEYERKEVI